MTYFITNKYVALCSIIVFLFTKVSAQEAYYFSGADELVNNHISEIQGKNIAVVTNKTAILVNGVHLLDTLLTFDDVRITKVFTPEHGFKGNYEAGAKVGNDQKTGLNLQFISLYGKHKKPTRNDLKDVDLIIYDIQDLGVRFYTYISTLYYVIEAASENNVKMIVLDRPNPLNGNIVSGPLLQRDELSFVGIQPMPILYGMTPGELALYFNDLFLKKSGNKADIKIIKLKNWKRNSFINEYQNKWVSPSPNIPDFETALVYPGTALLEGTNVSEGRGTFSPFLQIGAPFINAKLLVDKLKDEEIKGAAFSAISFTPKSIKGMSENPKYLGQKCNGIAIKVTNPNEFNSVDFGIKLVKTIQKLFPDKLKFNKHFEKLAGKSFYIKCFKESSDYDYEEELENFKRIRKKYLLYK